MVLMCLTFIQTHPKSQSTLWTWVTMMCQHRFIACNRRSTLQEMVMVEEAVPV
jgi:hypothetical protein